MKRDKIGFIGQNYAEEYLKSKGHLIIATNFRYSFKELDILTFSKGKININEIRTRSKDMLDINEIFPPRKLNHLNSARKGIFPTARINLISVILNKNMRPKRINLLKYEEIFY